MGGGPWGIWPFLVRGPAPIYPPYKNKNGKNQQFLAFIFLPPYPHPTTPHTHPNKK